MANTVFRKESLDKVSSPEQLNDYIKVSRPSIWIIIGSAIVLLVSGLVWAAAANLNTSVSASGVAKDGTVVCYMADISQVSDGAQVTLPGSIKGKVVSVSAKPLSLAEVSALYDDYTVYSLGLSDWNYAVEISAPDIQNGVVSAQIITDTVKPISFILN